MKNMKKLFAVVALLLMAVVAQAQGQTVKGTVLDEAGEPMIGATVKAVGGQGGTVTDLDGNYVLKVDQKVKQIEVAYVGYRNQKIQIKNGRADARMSTDKNELNELVVIGYGSVKKGDITNAVAKVKAEELAERPVSNIASALQGELAGVDVQSTSGAPGSSVQIKVRGATSINEDGNTNPLYVVDGVPMDEGFDLQQLNPQDIESIEVLKDASSSAIYGSRGANGVIIITCKKGNDDGKTTVTASVNFAISTPERYIPVMEAEDWINWRMKSNYQAYLEAYPTAGAQSGDSYLEQVIKAQGGAGTSAVIDPRWRMPGYGGLSLVDWQKAMFRPSFAQTYNLSITQGNKKNSYRASVSYVNQDGIVINTGFKRLTAKLSGQTTLIDKLRIGVDVSPQMTVTTGGNVDGKDNAAQNALSAVPVVENNAGLHTATEPYNRYMYAGSTASPVTVMEQRYYRDEQIRIQASGFADYEIMKGWNAKVLGSWIFNNRDRKRFTPSSASRFWNSGEGYYADSYWIGSRSHKYHIEATTTYDHTWDKHHLNVVGGWSLESTQDGNSYNLNVTQFPNNTIMGWTINDVTPTTFTATYTTDDHLISYFARAEYGYDSRYLLNASLRRDGSSHFGPNRKWGTFPAVSVAWRASNEKFWKPDWWVNQAKLRISYGSNGSNAISTNAADGLMTASYYSKDGAAITGYVPASTANPDLGWQKTNSWNFGIDMSLFNNRISFALDYYIKNVSDMLYQVSMPSVIGYAKAYQNIGNIRTKGVELELKTENLVGKLKWTTKFSMGYSTNEVKSLGNNSAIYTGYDNKTQIIEVGHPVGEYYLYLQRYPTESTSVVGSVRYRDINGDGIIDENDRTYCGKPQPSWTFGLTNSFKWKNWDASFLITAQAGGKIWQGLARAIDMQAQDVTINRLDRWQDMWLSEAAPGNGEVPRARGGSAEQFSTRWLYSTDFLKLKNITIGYRWRLPKKFALKVVRFTASCENVFMFTGYKNGYSPESNNSNSQVAVYDYGAYPAARTFSLGINATF